MMKENPKSGRDTRNMSTTPDKIKDFKCSFKIKWPYQLILLSFKFLIKSLTLKRPASKQECNFSFLDMFFK